jgi:hypothetical protein
MGNILSNKKNRKNKYNFVYETLDEQQDETQYNASDKDTSTCRKYHSEFKCAEIDMLEKHIVYLHFKLLGLDIDCEYKDIQIE